MRSVPRRVKKDVLSEGKGFVLCSVVVPYGEIWEFSATWFGMVQLTPGGNCRKTSIGFTFLC